MFIGVNISYALDVIETNFAPRADIEGITCILIVLPHIELETGLLVSGVTAVAARKLFE